MGENHLLRNHFLKLDQRQTISEKVYQKLRQAILYGHLKPGERLLEEELARLMDVSRTPIREALRRLELERLVTIKSHKGAMVTEFSIEEAQEFYEVRAVLEGYAAKLAALRATPQDHEEMRRLTEDFRAAKKQGDIEQIIDQNHAFHLAICQASQNRFLKEILGTLVAYVNLSRISVWAIPGRRVEETVEEHQGILAAIIAGDAHEAGRRAVEHVENSCRSAIAQYFGVAPESNAPVGTVGKEIPRQEEHRRNKGGI